MNEKALASSEAAPGWCLLFLSGATFPITILPEWAQLVSQFMPASYLVTGFQGIFFRNEPFSANWPSLLALLATLLLGTFLSMQLFRWEKDEKIRTSARLWVLVALLPFLVLGSYQAYSREHLRKARLLMRDLERSVCGCAYGSTSWTTRQEAERIAQLLELGPAAKLLDVGAGTGWPSSAATSTTSPG